MSYLQTIIALSGKDNLGSILELQVARKADIVSIPAPIDGVIYGDIEFEPGTGFVTWSFTQDTASVNSDGKVSREGFSKVNRLPFKIPKGRANLTAMFDRATEDELIVLYKENGKQKIFGTLEAPVKFTYSHKTGENLSDPNHYACSFYYEGPDNAFEFDGKIEVVPGGAVPVLVKYNGVTIASLQPGEVFNIISDFGFTDFYTSTTT
jgi:hypothetical protein